MKTAPKKATRIKAGRIQRANYKWIYLFLLPTIVIFAMFYAILFEIFFRCMLTVLAAKQAQRW